jgi:hypothetical protein
MIGVRFAVPVAITVALAIGACFAHPLFGGGASYQYNGIDPNTPIPDGTPNQNASTASGLIGGRRDAGADARTLGD